MKKAILAAVIAGGMCLLNCGAASAQSSGDTGRPEMKGDRGGRPEEAASLTDAQKATVKSILSKYTASSLTAADAKAIHRAYRDAGIRKGPGLNEAVKSAGFDPEKLKTLDPPPDMQDRKGQGGEQSEHGQRSGGQGKKQD